MVSNSMITSVQLPILDLSQPLHLSCVSTIARACKEWGFFYITNHGISVDSYNKIHAVSKQLFTLPLETKIKLGPLSFAKTYTPRFIASPLFESLKVSGPNFTASAKYSANVLFDQYNSSFSEMLQEYGSKMTELSKKILRVILMGLGDGLEGKYFDLDFKNCYGYVRINSYSPPEIFEEEQAEGLGMHTDMSCITIVYQDDVGGLQVRSKEGKWMDIVPQKGMLVVNVGDMLQAWSNDKFRSSEHKVVLKKHLNRFSLAFFWCFEDEKVIISPEEVVGKGNMRMYKPFVCLDYLKFRESNENGKFEKVGFTVKDFAGIELSHKI